MAGAAGGLACAFNAPLAGVLFVMEEMRTGFKFNFTNFQIVTISCVMATIMLHFIIGPEAAIPMDIYELPSLKSLWLFFIFGIVVGFVGLLFNKSLMGALALTDKLTKGFANLLCVNRGCYCWLSCLLSTRMGGWRL